MSTTPQQPTNDGDDDITGVAPAQPDGEARTTVSDREAAPVTPGRGAHLQSRRPPVPPEPDEDGGAPTTALPPFGTPLTDSPIGEPHTDAPTGAVRRTSFRADLDSHGPHLTDRLSTTPPPAPAPPRPLYGTGPSDVQVPPGDATVVVPQATSPAVPAAPTPVTEQSVPTAKSRARRAGRALIGMLIGMLAGAVGCALVLYGQSRILSVQAPSWDASYDPLGVVLVTIGVLILAALVATGSWSSAAPTTGGLLTAAIGVVYLYVPATMHAETFTRLSIDDARATVEQVVVTATSGTLFVIGALLLAAGITCAVLNRRRSRHA